MKKVKPPSEELRHLYVDQRLTSRQIGVRYGVSKTAVLRWLKEDGVDRRDPMDRGVKVPPREVLHELVHGQHMSYRAIAEYFDVSSINTVQQWLEKYGIERPGIWETRRKGFTPVRPDDETLRRLYESEGWSAVDLAATIGVGAKLMASWLREAGVTIRPAGYNGGCQLTCKDGHQVRSKYEQLIDDWLRDHAVEHVYEPHLSVDLRYRADFLANGWYVEIWGVTNSRTYIERRKRKMRMYETMNAPLISLEPPDFLLASARWTEKIAQVLHPPAAS